MDRIFYTFECFFFHFSVFLYNLTSHIDGATFRKLENKNFFGMMIYSSLHLALFIYNQ